LEKINRLDKGKSVALVVVDAVSSKKQAMRVCAE
jgi:hypothetical protein